MGVGDIYVNLIQCHRYAYLYMDELYNSIKVI